MHITEGGNVQIGNQSAQQIDLTQMDRSEIVKKLSRSLQAINGAFKRQFQRDMWNLELRKTKEFLSGSSLHFFNKAIPDTVFRSIKPKVGDIDTQVDKNDANDVELFLTSITNKTLGYLTLIGFKKSAGQLISLWNLNKPDINIQIDFEFVEYVDNTPTDWSSFSHSSSWEDMKLGIKGYGHKMALRALSTKSLRDVIILKGKKQTPTKVKTTDLAFSVTQGLREKIRPVLDDSGKQRFDGDLPVFEEIPTKNSNYITDLNMMFSTFFGVNATPQELKQFYSFKGICELVAKYFNPDESAKFIEGLAFSFWGKGAQSLYRDDVARDQKEKTITLEVALSITKAKPDMQAIEKLKKDYYQ